MVVPFFALYHIILCTRVAGSPHRWTNLPRYKLAQCSSPAGAELGKSVPSCLGFIVCGGVVVSYILVLGGTTTGSSAMPDAGVPCHQNLEAPALAVSSSSRQQLCSRMLEKNNNSG